MKKHNFKKKMRVYTFIKGIARHFASYDLLRTQNGRLIKRLFVHIIIVSIYKKRLTIISTGREDDMLWIYVIGIIIVILLVFFVVLPIATKFSWILPLTAPSRMPR